MAAQAALQHDTVATATSTDAPRPQSGWQRRHWIALAVLAVVEIVVSVSLALLNPMSGHDESCYLINSLHIRGSDALPYWNHRPPLFPLLLALFGDQYRLVSAFAHIASTATVLFIARRLFPPAVAIGTVLLFMASAQMRYYNVVALAELPSVFLLLLIILTFLARRPFLTGIVTMLLVMNHWSMVSIPPVVGLVYLIKRERLPLAWYAAGVAVVGIPLFVTFAILYGHPLAPLIASAAIHTEFNDLLYYARAFPTKWLPLAAGAVAAVWWLIRTRSSVGATRSRTLCLLIVGLIIARLAVLHVHYTKDARFLAVLMPLLMLLSVVALTKYRTNLGRWRFAVWVILFASVVPGRTFLWQMNSLRRTWAHQLDRLQPSIDRFTNGKQLYADPYHLVVMAHTRLPVIGVARPGNRNLRTHCNGGLLADRESIPEGALYLTWDPGKGEVLATAPSANDDHGTLYLVRWGSG